MNILFYKKDEARSSRIVRWYSGDISRIDHFLINLQDSTIATEDSIDFCTSYCSIILILLEPLCYVRASGKRGDDVGLPRSIVKLTLIKLYR